MKKTGCDHYEKYPYYDIISYELCHDCKYFYDNELETEFECHRNIEPDYDGWTCHIYKYDLELI